MAKEPEPKTLARLRGDAEPEGEGLLKENQGEHPTVRGTVPDSKKEKLEAEDIIRSLIQKENNLAVVGSIRLVIWHLSVLAYFALLIIILLGLGVITLPTALVFAVVGPLLSGVVGLLGILVKHLSRKD